MVGVQLNASIDLIAEAPRWWSRPRKVRYSRRPGYPMDVIPHPNNSSALKNKKVFRKDCDLYRVAAAGYYAGPVHQA